MITIKSDWELSCMRKAGLIVAKTLDLLGRSIAPGVTTGELDRMAEEFIRSQQALPAFKGYNGFPATICASVNEEVVHGIPGNRVLNEGDIISVDVGVIVDGYYGDAAVTFPVGNISVEAQALIDVTRQSFFEGIKFAKSGNRLTDISHAIQTYVESHGFSVVRKYVGHGIGTKMHEEPQVPNFGQPGRGPKLEPGMTLAIEPMVNMGDYRVCTLENQWTVVTCDGSLSAHYENTIAITEQGPWILTCL